MSATPEIQKAVMDIITARRMAENARKLEVARKIFAEHLRVLEDPASLKYLSETAIMRHSFIGAFLFADQCVMEVELSLKNE
jgi:hypothetical protein